MVSLLTMIVVMLIAFTTNLGKLVTEKIAMQNAVDMAVYSGAATQAGYLNKMRKVNQDVWEVHDRVRQRLEPSKTPGNPFFMGPPCPPCTPIFPGRINAPAADAYMQAEKAIVEAYLVQFDILNMRAPGDAFTAAQDAAEANYKGTRSKLQEKARSPGPLLPVKTDTVDWAYMGWAFSPCPPGPPIICRANLVTEIKVKTWKFRDPGRSGEAMFAAGIEDATPASPFLDGGYLGQFFAGNCRYGGGTGGRCALNVYAAAHPHQGKLGSIPRQGGTMAERMWVPQTNNPMPIAPAGVESRSALRPHKVFDNQYYDYKVRFIGIFESDARTLTGMPLRTAVHPTYGSKMEH